MRYGPSGTTLSPRPTQQENRGTALFPNDARRPGSLAGGATGVYFPCHQWFDKQHGMAKELFPMRKDDSRKKVPYAVKVIGGGHQERIMELRSNDCWMLTARMPRMLTPCIYSPILLHLLTLQYRIACA